MLIKFTDGNVSEVEVDGEVGLVISAINIYIDSLVQVDSNSKIDTANLAEENTKVETSRKESRIFWKIIIPVVVGIVSTIISTIIIVALDLTGK